jgi:hypothetical protein
MTEKFTVKMLKSVHPIYELLVKEWTFLYAAYEGTRELVSQGYLTKHERETTENHIRRMKDAYGFNFTQSVVDIFTFYLFKKSVKRTVPLSVEKDELWEMFQKDSNLYHDGIDEFLAEQSRLASIMGYVGIMVDKATKELDSRKEQLENEVYPYLSSYFPNAILDWDFTRDDYGRPKLEMVKLLQDDNQYLIWYRDRYEIWEMPEVDPAVSQLLDDAEAKLIKNQPHSLGEIPFIFLVNKKWKIRPIGKSDVSDVARIDMSIIRNLSQGEEIVDYSAFPMMRKPNLDVRPDQNVDQSDDVGVTSVLGFDPDNPESKPDWLESEAADPLNAIIAWIENKIEQIYRASNIGGMAATEISTSPKSGTALTAEFQLLNSSLVRKAINLEKAERQITYFWYLWEYGLIEAKKRLKETVIERSRSYDVENMAEDLENALTAKTLVMSKTFHEAIQKKTVRKMLPSWTDNQLQDIDSEIEVSTIDPATSGVSVYPPEEDDEDTNSDNNKKNIVNLPVRK